MTLTLAKASAILRANRKALRLRGILHAAIFGSVARGEARPDSDLDILVELQPGNPSGIYEYVRLEADLSKLFDRKVDLIERGTLKPIAAASALKEAVDVF